MRQPQQQQERKPGRSFEDPSKPMGQEILERSATTEGPREDFRSREEQAGASQHGVAERAKVIAVLRKAEELLAEENLPPDPAQRTVERALELAAGRVGLTIEEYRALLKGDTELEQLEAKVIAEGRAKLGH
jgi:hypothetical protein